MSKYCVRYLAEIQ